MPPPRIIQSSCLIPKHSPMNIIRSYIGPRRVVDDDTNSHSTLVSSIDTYI